MGKRISDMSLWVLGDMSDTGRLVYCNPNSSPPATAAVQLSVVRSALTVPSTDHTGTLGDASHRWLATHADQSLLYGGGSVVASTPLISGTQTWNNGAIKFTGILENITNTASLATSLLMDLQVSGTSKFAVDVAGNVAAAGTITAPTFTGALSGNAATASVASAVAAAAITGATLAAGVTASSLTRLGRIAALLATKAQSFTATVSAPTGSTTLAATMAVAGVYLVVVQYPGIVPASYLVVFDGASTSAVSTIVVGPTTITVAVTGTSLNVSQSSGVTKAITLSYLLLNL